MSRETGPLCDGLPSCLDGSHGTLVVGEGGPASRLDTSNAAIKFIIQSQG